MMVSRSPLKASGSQWRKPNSVGDSARNAAGAAPRLKMWLAMDDWLLRDVLLYLDEDDVYQLWVFAEEHRLDRVCEYLAVCSAAPLSKQRALGFAMGYACWTAVCRLTKAPHKQHLSRRLVDDIIDEIQRHVTVPLPPHPDREIAMMTAARPGSVPPFVMYFAARQGNLESAMWLHNVARYDPTEALRVAARHGHDHVIAWLLEKVQTTRWILKGCEVEPVFGYEDDPGMDILAWRVTYEEGSHVSAFSRKWGFADFHRQGSAEYGVVDLPAKHGDLEAIKRLLSYDLFQNSDHRRTVQHAVRAGHLHIIEWFYEHHPDIFDDAGFLIQAAAHGQLEVVRWIAAHGKHTEDMGDTFEAAAGNGHLAVLRWLAEAFPECAATHVNENLSSIVCQQGHLAIAEWLVNVRGIRVERDHLTRAATGGHIALFQWLLARLQQDSAETIRRDPLWLDGAAGSGDFAFVQWLVEDCSLWSSSALVMTVNPDVIEYLHSFALLHNKSLEGITSVECATTIRNGAYETITRLLKHGLRADYFDKKWFNHIPDFEALFMRRQDQLGWSDDCTPARECWPQTLTCILRLREMVRVVIDVYDPTFLRTITWLPKWTVQHGTIQNLERLAEIEHDKLLTPEVFRLFLRTSSNADKVRWFVTRSPPLFSTNVVQWAVQYDKRRLLTWILAEFVPERQRQLGSDSKLLSHCVQAAVRSAYKCGRKEIGLWLEAIGWQ